MSTEIKKNGEPSPMAARLEHVRVKIAGIKTLSGFHELMTQGPPPPTVELGVSYAAARTWHMGSTYGGEVRHPPYVYLQRILDLFPEVRAEWLMRGEGAPTEMEEALRLAHQERDSQETQWWVFAQEFADVFPAYADLDPSVRQCVLTVASDAAIRHSQEIAQAENMERLPAGFYMGVVRERMQIIHDAIYQPIRQLGLPLADARPDDRLFTRYAMAVIMALDIAIGSDRSWSRVWTGGQSWSHDGPDNETGATPAKE